MVTLVLFAGTWFRGESSEGKLVKLSAHDIYQMSHKECILKVRHIRVDNIQYRQVSIVLGVARWSSLEMSRSVPCSVADLGSARNPPALSPILFNFFMQ